MRQTVWKWLCLKHENLEIKIEKIKIRMENYMF